MECQFRLTCGFFWLEDWREEQKAGKPNSFFLKNSCLSEHFFRVNKKSFVDNFLTFFLLNLSKWVHVVMTWSYLGKAYVLRLMTTMSGTIVGLLVIIKWQACDNGSLDIGDSTWGAYVDAFGTNTIKIAP